MTFPPVRKISNTGQNILKKRYLHPGESTWDDVTNRVVEYVIGDWKNINNKELFREMMLNRYFIPNSPCLVNANKNGGGLLACFVVDFQDTIEDIYKTKLDFALIAKKGGGCGTTLSHIRPKNSPVAGSTHGYSGGPVDFFDTICKDMEVMTQAGFRSMAMMGTMSVYHPDIIQFITVKETEEKMTTTNLSVVVDNKFMQAVINDETYWTEFNGKKYQEYKAREVFNLIVEGAWKNGEPGILFFDEINNNSPYKYAGVTIYATNPCISGETYIDTVDGKIKIKDLVGKETDVYCMVTNGDIGISKAFNIRKTRNKSKVIKITTTREEIICTEDHLFYTRNRGYVKAIDLKISDKIVGLNRKMSNERQISVALTGGKYIKEHRLIAGHYQDIVGKDVHHIDNNPLNNIKSNLEVLNHSYHSSISNMGHEDWNERNSKGQFLSKDSRKKRKQISSNSTNKKGINLKIISIENLPNTEDVYDMEVEKYHNFIANGIVIHNCGEQPLPPNGSCNLGSIDLSKFLDSNKELSWEKLELAVRLSIRFLDSVIDKNSFPTKEIEETSLKSRQVGLGIMGWADYLLLKEIAYGSQESLNELEKILSFIYNIAENESVIMGEELGVPEWCKKLPTPRRNITLLSIAPTGTISLLAGCNSGIEPIFSEITVRNDKTGTYQFVNDLSNQPYFKCAVSSNGSEKEVTWEEHVNTQSISQKYVDSGVSKTINFPTHTRRETIYNAFILAWQSECKGITVYRNGSRKTEVLSPKNLKKDKCPVCESEIAIIKGTKKCLKCNWKMGETVIIGGHDVD